MGGDGADAGSVGHDDTDGYFGDDLISGRPWNDRATIDGTDDARGFED